MARLLLSAGESVGLSSGTYNIFGTTTGKETVTVAAGASVVLDASFNAGGDVIQLAGNAADYTAVRSGSSLVLTSATGGSVTIPVGTTAATVQFADAARSLVYNTASAAVELGTQAVGSTSATVAAGTGGAASAGKDIILTAGQDLVHATSTTSVDTIRGTFDTAGTLSTGDEITGNGNTVVQLIVDNAGATPFYQMSGVDKLVFLNNTGGGTITVNPTQIGTDVNSIAVKGNDGLNIDAQSLKVTGALDLTVGAGNDGDINFDGTIDGISASGYLHGNNGSTETTLHVGTAGITANAGKSDAYAYLYNTSAAASATVGSLTVGDVNLKVGSGSVDVTLSNDARASAPVGAAAKAGDIKAGSLTLDVGAGGEAYFYEWNNAYATLGRTGGKGSATVGNLTVGDAVVKLATSAYASYELTNDAASEKGAATVGNITAGNFTATAASGATDAGTYVFLQNRADANVSGDAKTGNITAGDLTIALKDTSGYQGYTASNEAYADKGAATTGNVRLGKVDFSAGDDTSGGNSWVYLNVQQDASVSISGAATVGTTTIGDITMAVGDDYGVQPTIGLYATAAAGAANIGATTIGNVKLSGGDASFANFQFDDKLNIASTFKAASSIGAVTIGSVDMVAGNSGSVSLSISIDADEGTAKGLTIGNVSAAVGNSGSVDFSIHYAGDLGVGNVKLGNVSIVMGENGTLEDAFPLVDVAATATLLGTVGNVTMGNVDISLGKNTTVAGHTNSDELLSIDAGKTIGDVTVGNVSLAAATSASFDADIRITSEKAMGAFTIGNVSVAAGISASISHDEYLQSNDATIGNVTGGTITITASESGTAEMWREVHAAGNLGVIKTGNVSIAATGDNAYGYLYLGAENDTNGAGNGEYDLTSFTVGDLAMTATGEAASASFEAYVTAETSGDVTIGNITLALSAATTAAAGNINVVSNATIGANIKVGNVTIEATGVADPSLAFDSNGTVTLGNITVKGDATGAGNLFTDVLSLTGTSKTVGNIDYSGFDNAATINMTGIKGGSIIKAALGDTTITDNSSKNVITLSTGDDAVTIVSGNTGKTEATADQIIGFSTAHDTINLKTSGGTDFHYNSTSATSVTAFLTQAATYIADHVGLEAYSGKVGSDSWVAIDKEGNGSIDYVVQFVGVQMAATGGYLTIG